MTLTILAIAACTSKPDSNTPSVEEANVSPLLGLWQVEDIDQGGIIDYSMITLHIEENGRVSGSTGCNRYSANTIIENGFINISQAISTRKACPPALMNQEQRFLSALSSAVAYDLLENDIVIIVDQQGQQKLRMIKLPNSSSSNI